MTSDADFWTRHAAMRADRRAGARAVGLFMLACMCAMIVVAVIA